MCTNPPAVPKAVVSPDEEMARAVIMSPSQFTWCGVVRPEPCTSEVRKKPLAEPMVSMEVNIGWKRSMVGPAPKGMWDTARGGPLMSYTCTRLSITSCPLRTCSPAVARRSPFISIAVSPPACGITLRAAVKLALGSQSATAPWVQPTATSPRPAKERTMNASPATSAFETNLPVTRSWVASALSLRPTIACPDRMSTSQLSMSAPAAVSTPGAW
mmetsp:Transcript_13919/g.39391  ORF Transcript_13919/g.39391 Transcript_13919/m.39391 type:complete len:215 (-) Transcript_13919:549-1193(-)